MPWAAAALLALGAVIAGVMAWGVMASWIPGPSTSMAAGSVDALYDIRARDTTSSQPVGVAVSGDRVYVADAARGRIDVYTRDGAHVQAIGAGFLKAPVHVAIGPVDGRLYVTDRGRDAVVVYSVDGKRLRLLGSGGVDPTTTPTPWRPLALGFADDGTLYVADASERQQIVVFSPMGRRTDAFGADLPAGRTGSPLSFPNGIAVTGNTVLVADSNNGRILVLGRDGRFVRQVLTDGLPRGVAAAAGGGFVVADAAMNTVRVYSAGGRPVALAGLTGATAGLFSAPSDVAISDDGRIFVGNTGVGRVDVIRMSAVVPRARSTAGSDWTWLVVAAVFAAAAAAAAVLALRLSRRVVHNDAS